MSKPPSKAQVKSNEATVSGGGAVERVRQQSGDDQLRVARQYGVAAGGLLAATSTSQAGAHPNVTSEFFLNTINPNGEANAAKTALQ